MQAKIQLKEKAIELRKQGLSYLEIRRDIPVSKSTLSLWLREVYLNQALRNRLKQRSLLSPWLGGEAKKKQRQDKVKNITMTARSEINPITEENLLLMGTMLYWGEGAKQRENNPSQQVCFSNSDPLMCKLFLKWLKTSLKLEENVIKARIYIHRSQKTKAKRALKFWSQKTGIPIQKFEKTSFTNTKLSKKNKRNDRAEYFGQLRITIRKSTDLNRRITGLIQGVCVQAGII